MTKKKNNKTKQICRSADKTRPQETQLIQCPKRKKKREDKTTKCNHYKKEKCQQECSEEATHSPPKYKEKKKHTTIQFSGNMSAKQDLRRWYWLLWVFSWFLGSKTGLDQTELTSHLFFHGRAFLSGLSHVVLTTYNALLLATRWEIAMKHTH